MHPMVPVVTALYSLACNVGLTPEERGEVERTAPSLTGTLWRETRALLREADRGPPGTTVDLGYTALVLRWLGFADERGFEEAHGMGIGEAIGRARGRLGELARALEGDGAAAAGDVRCAVAWVWCLRSARLHAGLPGTGAAIVTAIERALEMSPAGEDFHRPMLQTMVEVCTLVGDRDRAAAARERLEDLEREAERRSGRDALLGVAAYLLSVLRCISRDEDLLASERGLDPEVEPLPGTWARVRSAVAGGEVEAIPLPLRTLAAWGMDEAFTETVLRSALVETGDALPELVRAVELMWGREDAEVSAEAARAVARALEVRHHELERGFEPLPGERSDLAHELFQGAARPETSERFALMSRALEAIATRPEDYPMVYARVHLLAAGVLEWRGEPDLAREQLDRAVASASGAPPEERSEAEVCLAAFVWRCADPGEAKRRLRALEGPAAAGVLAEIEAKADCRRALRGAERVARDRGDARSRRRLALAHAAAGHAVEAERLAAEWVSLAPEEPLALATLAQVLHDVGRYRDAIEPARAALVRGHDEVAGAVLLARTLSRIGPEGRKEAAALALAVIDAHPGEGALAGAELADMARIAHGGSAPVERCRLADDRLEALCETGERPEEWLGAAVARRCHGLFAKDAPAWLARLAEVGDEEPVELARWLVERVEALQHFRLVAGRSLFGAVESLEAERGLAARADALLAERYDHRVGPEGPDTDALPGGTAVWEPHLPAVEGAFGEGLAARLRASERAQALLFGADGARERETALALGAVEAEHAAWVRWAGTCEALKEAAAGHAGGVATATAARLKPILDLAASGDEETIRSAAWPNRWHEAERKVCRAGDAREPR